jgi:hypothetical protein
MTLNCRITSKITNYFSCYTNSSGKQWAGEGGFSSSLPSSKQKIKVGSLTKKLGIEDGTDAKDGS